MKKTVISAVLAICAFFSNGQQNQKAGSKCDLGVTINQEYSKAAKIDSIIKNYTPSLLPGVSIAVYSEAKAGGSAHRAMRKRKIKQRWTMAIYNMCKVFPKCIWLLKSCN
ncbi:MAG: hypothetical protein WDO19_01920 [Bacteroidota bacterium]